MPLALPPGAAGFQGILGIGNGGSGAALAKDAMRLLSGVYVIAQSAVQVPLTGTINRTTLATVQVPAGAMGANGRLRISSLWSYTNSSNNKTLGVRFNGASGTLYQNVTLTTTASYRGVLEIANRNATNSQIGAPNGLTSGAGSTSGSVVTSSIDTTAAVDIVFEGTLASSGETINLESYLVELLAGAGS